MKIVLQQRTGEASPPDMHLDMPSDATVGTLKSRVTDLHLARPPAEFQKLIFGGRLLTDDNMKLIDALQMSYDEKDSEREYKFWLLLPKPIAEVLASPKSPLMTPQTPASAPAEHSANSNAAATGTPVSSDRPASDSADRDTDGTTRRRSHRRKESVEDAGQAGEGSSSGGRASPRDRLGSIDGTGSSSKDRRRRDKERDKDRTPSSPATGPASLPHAVSVPSPLGLPPSSPAMAQPGMGMGMGMGMGGHIFGGMQQAYDVQAGMAAAAPVPMPATPLPFALPGQALSISGADMVRGAAAAAAIPVPASPTSPSGALSTAPNTPAEIPAFGGPGLHIGIPSIPASPAQPVQTLPLGAAASAAMGTPGSLPGAVFGASAVLSGAANANLAPAARAGAEVPIPASPAAVPCPPGHNAAMPPPSPLMMAMMQHNEALQAQIAMLQQQQQRLLAHASFSAAQAQAAAAAAGSSAGMGSASIPSSPLALRTPLFGPGTPIMGMAPLSAYSPALGMMPGTPGSMMPTALGMGFGLPGPAGGMMPGMVAMGTPGTPLAFQGLPGGPMMGMGMGMVPGMGGAGVYGMPAPLPMLSLDGAADGPNTPGADAKKRSKDKEKERDRERAVASGRRSKRASVANEAEAREGDSGRASRDKDQAGQSTGTPSGRAMDSSDGRSEVDAITLSRGITSRRCEGRGHEAEDSGRGHRSERRRHRRAEGQDEADDEANVMQDGLRQRLRAAEPPQGAGAADMGAGAGGAEAGAGPAAGAGGAAQAGADGQERAAADGAAEAPQGLRRFVDVGLIFRLVAVSFMFTQGASQDRVMTVAGALTLVYLFKVGILGIIWDTIRTRLCCCLTRRAATPAAPAAGQADQEAAAPPRRFPQTPHENLTAWLVMGRGYIICDAFALVAALLLSFVPTWVPDEELRPHVQR